MKSIYKKAKAKGYSSGLAELYEGDRLKRWLEIDSVNLFTALYGEEIHKNASTIPEWKWHWNIAANKYVTGEIASPLDYVVESQSD